MEDDDEFGDLYTDVLKPFASNPPPLSSSSAPSRPPPHASSSSSSTQPSPPPPPSPSTDQNFDTSDKASGGGGGEGGDAGFLLGAQNRDNRPPQPGKALALSLNSARDESASGGHGSISETRVSNLQDSKLEDGRGDWGAREGKGLDTMDADVKFDIEENNEHGMDTVIPGISEPSRGSGGGAGGDAGGGGDGGDDWDSESDDDLQIVLNDNMAHHGPIGMIGDADEEDDDDEDGDPLVIVADGDSNQPMVEQDWGEDASEPGPDGERKEGGGSGEAAKANGGLVIAPKVGYSNLGYHPFHSQFKYVRPGASPMPGSSSAAPGGAPGQVRPPVNVSPLAGRGRGDWRLTGLKNTPLQKNFHQGFGATSWGSGRGYGGGLEFSLPSHKTIFEVDIDSFEEKPWRYPGVDSTDFFNFGLNEESWKEYCKQLDTLRLEATMQSKIHVYESGRTEQEFDPDLPPELAAASGIQDVTAENAASAKPETVQSDIKASVRVRPPLPTGRAIQVESGYGERLPSIDTRPPRIRDSDAIIEIVCQDSLDDNSSSANDLADREDNDPASEDLRGAQTVQEGIAQEEAESIDGLSESHSGQKKEVVEKAQLVDSSRHDTPEGEESSPFHHEGSLQYGPSSRGQTSGHPSAKTVNTHSERRTQIRTRDHSPYLSPNHSVDDKNVPGHHEEQIVGSVDGDEAVHESSIENKNASADAPSPADGSSELDKNELVSDVGKAGETLKLLSSRRKEKSDSRVEQTALLEFDEADDNRAARSTENSKARSGSSRDSLKWRDGTDEEVVQAGLPSHVGGARRHREDNEQKLRRKDHDRRQEMDRRRVAVKERVDPYRDWDPSSVHNLPMKSDGFDRRKERDYPDGAWRLKDDEPNSRRARIEDSRKRDRADEIGSRHRSRGRESERNDKEEHLNSRKQLDNGIYKVNYDKEVPIRGRERDDSLRSKYDNSDDYRNKRKKADEYVKRDRDRAEKEETLRDHTESAGRRKRERDDNMDQRQREDQARVRDSIDDHHSFRHKDETWAPREKSEKLRDREEWHKVKPNYEENRSKREREEERAAVRGGRGGEDKSWAAQDRGKDDHKASGKEHQFKDVGRYSEHAKRREHVEDESFLQFRGHEDAHARGNQMNNEERRSRQEKSSSRHDKLFSASDNSRTQEKKHRENHRKNKEFEGGDRQSSKRNQDDHVDHFSQMGTADPEASQQFHSSRETRENMSSEDEQSESRRGRSKLERWTSHKERDYSIHSKSSSSLRYKEVGRHNVVGSSEASKLPESVKTAEAVDKHHSAAEDREAVDVEKKDADAKPLSDRHLDTVEKLKKRSERFKLPMPGEKEVSSVKKLESEPLPAAKGETLVDPEIKQERPARKRRWTNN